MGTKREELEKMARGEGCLGKAADDEPIFIVRAQDLFSDGLVDDWANKAEGRRCPPKKVAESRGLAALMRAWPTRKYPD